MDNFLNCTLHFPPEQRSVSTIILRMGALLQNVLAKIHQFIYRLCYSYYMENNYIGTLSIQQLLLKFNLSGELRSNFKFVTWYVLYISGIQISQMFWTTRRKIIGLSSPPPYHILTNNFKILTLFTVI